MFDGESLTPPSYLRQLMVKLGMVYYAVIMDLPLQGYLKHRTSGDLGLDLADPYLSESGVAHHV